MIVKIGIKKKTMPHIKLWLPLNIPYIDVNKDTKGAVASANPKIAGRAIDIRSRVQ